jgi:hypothetical protein
LTEIDPLRRAGAARRAGFTALLLGVACLTSFLGSAREHAFSIGGIIFMVVTGVLCLFLAITWWDVRRG